MDAERWITETAGVDRRHRRDVARHVTVIDLPPGDVLCQEGQLVREVFILLSGEVEVTHIGRHIATVAGPSVIGELALVNNSDARTADVTTLTDVTVAVASSSEYAYLMHTYPAFAQWVNGLAGQRTV